MGSRSRMYVLSAQREDYPPSQLYVPADSDKSYDHISSAPSEVIDIKPCRAHSSSSPAPTLRVICLTSHLYNSSFFFNIMAQTPSDAGSGTANTLPRGKACLRCRYVLLRLPLCPVELTCYTSRRKRKMVFARTATYLICTANFKLEMRWR